MIPLYDLNRTKHFPFITVGLIILNILVFLFEMKIQYSEGEAGMRSLFERYGVRPALLKAALAGQDEIVVEEKVLVRYQFSNDVRVETREKTIPVSFTACLLALVTSMFLHGGIGHLLGNLWFLWIFGDNVEDFLGHVKFLIFYLLTGLAATFCHVLVSLDSAMPTIGASGAISAVLGAYLLAYPTARIVTLLPIFYFIQIIEIPAYFYLIFWFVVQQLLPGLGGQSGGVAIWAHIGGFLAGLAFIFWYKKNKVPPRGPGRYVKFRMVRHG